MIQIVVMDKGFVSIGVVKLGTDWCEIEHAAVVRRWGTTKGLGQLADDGPTPNTILDKTPKQTVARHAIIKLIDCNESNWRDVLGLPVATKRKTRKP